MEVELARQQWQDGLRRVEGARGDGARYERLTGQVDVVVAGLRKRVGQVFTLAELADAYSGAEGWLLTVVGERAPSKGWARTASLAGDAAFHAYSRGAQDYEP